MNRIPLGYFLIAGLIFWGLPDCFFAGPSAILYTVVAVLPIWAVCHYSKPVEPRPPRRFSRATCTVLAGFAIIYIAWDALLGRKLFQMNMFLFHSAALSREIQQLNSGISKGGGIAALLGYILALMPFALIDAGRETARQRRWILWGIALLLLFYYSGAGRSFVMMAVVSIVLATSQSKRRLFIGGVLALGFFLLASSLRGDSAHGGNPVLSGTVFPFINLGLMLHAHCGTAPWYSYVGAFFKKFVPAFLYPKKVFSFNMEMSLCLYPTANNTVRSVSVFTWLGEIYYYKPSLVTALVAGIILAVLARAVDRRLVRNAMYSARLFAGFICFYLPRSRTQDIFTYLIAQLIFLIVVWPNLCNLTRNLYKFLMPAHNSGVAAAAERDTS